MPKTIRNKFDYYLTYEKLMEAHMKSKKGKGYRKEIIEFNLKQEEYIMWLLEQLKTQIFKNKQGVNFCGYKINEYRLKIRDKGKRKLKKKVKKLQEQIKLGQTTSKEAHKYLAGHLGYIKYADTKNLENTLFYFE